MGWGQSGEPGVAAVVLGWKLFQLLVLFHPAIYMIWGPKGISSQATSSAELCALKPSNALTISLGSSLLHQPFHFVSEKKNNKKKLHLECPHTMCNVAILKRKDGKTQPLVLATSFFNPS